MGKEVIFKYNYKISVMDPSDVQSPWKVLPNFTKFIYPKNLYF